MINLDDMAVESTLVDCVTGEVIGWNLRGVMVEEGTGDSYFCSITKEYLESIGSDLANYIEYTDNNLVEVLCHDDKYILKSNVTSMQDMELAEIPYIRESLDVAVIYGYRVRLRELLKLNDEYAIERARGN